MAVRVTHYNDGDVWEPQATFAVGGTPTDPTTIAASYKDPTGTVVNLGPFAGGTGGAGITRVSAGVYKLSITLNDTGHWFARFKGTGAAQATTPDHEAIVDPSEFHEDAQLASHALVTTAEARDWLQQINQEPPDALEIARLINDVSDRFQEEARREIKPRVANPSMRFFEWSNDWEPAYVDGELVGTRWPLNGYYRLPIGDLASFTAVDIVDYDWTTVLTPTIPLTDIIALPENRATWEPIRELRFHTDVTDLAPGRRVRVTGTWGFPSVPGTVRQAVLDAIAAIRDRDVEHYRQDIGVGTSIEGGGGTTIMLRGGGQRMLSLPPTTLAVAWDLRDNHLA